MPAEKPSCLIQSSRKLFCCLPLVVSGLLIGSSALWGQSAELSGTVKDLRGSVIPGAELSLVSAATDATYRSATTTEGYYVFRVLSPGKYVLTCSAKGFQETRLENLALDSGVRRWQDVILQVGTVTQEITVEANANSLNTVDGTVERRIGTSLIDTLPSSGNTLQSVLGALPGVILSAGSGSSTGGERGFASVNGQRTSSNGFSVDGIDATNGTGLPGQQSGLNFGGSLPQLTSFGGTNSMVQLDAIEEIRVATSSYSVRLGGKSGGQFEFTTKSGTSQFHGSVGYYFRNEQLAANNWFTNSASLPRAPLRLNQGAATIGGPVAIPGLHESQPQTFFFANVEILTMRQPQAAVISALSQTFIDSVQSQAMQNLLKALPTPETVTPEANYGSRTIAWSQPTTFGAGAIKVDRNLGKNARAFVRFMRVGDSVVQNSISSGGPFNLVQPMDTRSSTFGGGISWSSSRWTGELRAGVADNSSLQSRGIAPLFGAAPYDLAALIPSTLAGVGNPYVLATITAPATPIPYLAFSAYSPQGTRQSSVTASGVITRVLRRGIVEFGGSYRLLMPTNNRYDYTLSVGITNPAQLQQGLVSSVSLSKNTGTTEYSIQEIGAFSQLTYRIARNVSLSLGLRWDLYPAPTDRNNRPFYRVLLDGNAHLDANASTPYNTPIKCCFAPRGSVAWRLLDRGSRPLVLRVGGGLFYDRGGQNWANQIGPYGTGSQTFAGPLALGQGTPAMPAFLDSAQVVSPMTNIQGIDVEITLPYAIQYSAELEQALSSHDTISIGYVGNRVRHLARIYNLNLSGQSTTLGTVFYVRNDATSDYNSLQLLYQRRARSGLLAQAGYTLARAIDEDSFDGYNGRTSQRASSDYDIRHQLTGQLAYTLPRLGGRLRTVANNWKLAVNLIARSAPPLSVNGNLYTDPTGLAYYGGVDPVTGVPVWLHDIHAPGGKRINPSAFTLPAAGKLGALQRNFLRGFGAFQTDVSLTRDFAILEWLRLSIRADAFNLLNHPNFGVINTTLGAPKTFGFATGMLNNNLGSLSPLFQYGGPRTMQLHLRLSF
jgi:hypothetical protein